MRARWRTAGVLGAKVARVDPHRRAREAGRVLDVADACWAEGLQPGIGAPVLLALDPADADADPARIEELGLTVFTSTTALAGHVRQRAIGQSEQPLSAEVG